MPDGSRARRARPPSTRLTPLPRASGRCANPPPTGRRRAAGTRVPPGPPRGRPPQPDGRRISLHLLIDAEDRRVDAPWPRVADRVARPVLRRVRARAERATYPRPRREGWPRGRRGGGRSSAQERNRMRRGRVSGGAAYEGGATSAEQRRLRPACRRLDVRTRRFPDGFRQAPEASSASLPRSRAPLLASDAVAAS